MLISGIFVRLRVEKQISSVRRRKEKKVSKENATRMNLAIMLPHVIFERITLFAARVGTIPYLVIEITFLSFKEIGETGIEMSKKK